jgi:hypothetical protein
MASSTLFAPGSGRSGLKTALWISLGLTALFVFITSEVLLATDYPMYHAYRLQVIADRHLLIPHTLSGVIALVAGAISGADHPGGGLHGRSWHAGAAGGECDSGRGADKDGDYVDATQGAMEFQVTPAKARRKLHAAFIAARNRQIAQHRQWMVRSYAVTFTFVSSRVLNLWPVYWSHLGDSLAAVGVIAFTLASLLVADIGLNWRELTTRRA